VKLPEWQGDLQQAIHCKYCTFVHYLNWRCCGRWWWGAATCLVAADRNRGFIAESEESAEEQCRGVAWYRQNIFVIGGF